MKIISIVGARPEFIQAWPVSRALRRCHQEILIHTGQHYDYQMSQSFFDDLNLPAPDHSLGVGSGPHGQQTGEMLTRLEKIYQAEKPDLVLVRGDTNSTLAGILAASKLHIPTAHIEAGERSFDRRMPEEINRLVADCLADIHFCASQTAVCQLASEGITRRVQWVGDVMLDALLSFHAKAGSRQDSLMERLGLQPKNYSLLTIHRAATTDDPYRLAALAETLNEIDETIIFPVHPRTRNALQSTGVQFRDHIRLIDPVGYLDMLALESGARQVATDSGGVQREAYFLHIPCLTLREETEWTETVRTGWNRLVGVDPNAIKAAWFEFSPPREHPAIFGDGHAGERIAAALEDGLPLAA